MKLNNMAYPADEKNYDCYPCESSPSKYPYGLCLYLSEEQCEVLGIKEQLAPGTAIRIEAQAIVTRASSELDRDKDADGNSVSMSIQITDMGIEPAGVIADAAERLYGSK